MRKFWLILPAVALLAGGWWLLRERSPETAYRTAPLDRGSIVAAVAATGTLNAVTTVQVGTQVSGTIQRLHADFNTPVTRGQVIAEIDPALFQAQLEQAQGNHLSAQANLEKARVATVDASRNLERFRNLLERGFISRGEFDTAETTLLSALAAERAAEAAVVQTRGAVQQARTNLQHALIRSPVNGVVINRNIDVGQTVAASFQTPTLFTIAEDLTRMKIDTSVDEADIGRVRVGLPVSFTVDAWAGETFHGEVTQVRYAPIVNQNVVTYNVVVTVPNPEKKLFPGMTASVSIEVERRDDVLRLPAAALRFRPKNPGDAEASPAPRRESPQAQVYRLGPDEKPAAVRVRTGAGDGSFFELLEGDLKAGDQVITGQIQPREGQPRPGMPTGPRVR
jgi:HlyD family secretion protein